MGGGMLWSVIVPGAVVGSALMIELDTRTGIAVFTASYADGASHRLVVEHVCLDRIRNVVAHWPRKEGSDVG